MPFKRALPLSRSLCSHLVNTSVLVSPASLNQYRQFCSTATAVVVQPTKQSSSSSLDSELRKAGCEEYANVLKELGLSKLDDLRYLKEKDLLQRDVPLVNARKILDLQAAKSSLKAEDVMPVAPSMPQETMIKMNDYGLTRGERSTESILISSFLGGTFISFGASMFILLGGGTPMLQEALPGLHRVVSALVFPIGLSSIVLTSADLLTSNMMYATLPFASEDKRRVFDQKLYNLTRLFSLNFVGNFAGCLAVAFCMSTIFNSHPFDTFAEAIAYKKTHGDLLPTFVKAVGANWLVCIAVYQSMTAKTSPGKLAALWMPITTFVALGLEHSVANMYLIPLGMFCGADVTLSQFLVSNLIPVCLGNLVGASFFVSLLHWRFIMKSSLK